MAAALSRSWSFFSGNQKVPSKDYLGQDYQPGTPSSRVNLQERFRGGSGEGKGWRTGPLPPIPAPTPPHTHGSESAQHTEPTHPTENHQPPQPPHDQDSCPDQKENQENAQPSYPQCQWDHVASCGAKPGDQPNPSGARYPTRSLRKLPSGVAPLWNNLQGNVKQLKPQTSKILHEGGKKMNKALQGVRTSLSSLSQMFRSSTRRRYKLDGGTPTRTPRRTPRRTPGKLYSPFNMSTPPTPFSYKTAKRLQNGQNVVPKRNLHGTENPGLLRTPQQRTQWAQFSSPSRSLQRDTAAMSHGLRELEQITSGILQSGRGRWTQFR
ncbi:uncharacterized protein LOC123508836 isoform X1 [Portunus trituberculatus]|uniref:Uncharacterized protein n=1 Tax=Portunus trituberculatus TaxID=210409 RepID=A0A5B7E8W2_PORTR|nr:uncharacterized protein LOC123508836 isoform X1 [Portunus trituberculatus]MPC30208.1 hypothetical protein [Portunus trituberculatus]